jgi:2-(1,2-epoxy-1,2-dihydrophenyl)acetyl-CoA isomerase
LIVQRVRTSEYDWGTRLELCAPERRNALDQQAVADLQQAFAADGPGAVLLCAEGPAFCAGGDLSVLGRAAVDGALVDLLTTAAAAFADLIEAIVACPRPVVAAVDGPAVGGGASLVLACDIRIGTPRARLDLAWARHGLPPDGGATALLAAAVGPMRARSLLMEAAVVPADSELTPYVFSRIVPVDRLAPESLATASALAESPGGRAAKAATTALLLPALRQQRDEELAALARAAADPTTGERLAMLYKIDR